MEKGKVKGTLSNASAKRLNDLILNWFYIVKSAKGKNDSWDKYLAFITLTLPSKQVHSDREIKRKCLNTFLIYAARKWGVNTYIWKAEKQKNGNIHFHIIVNRFCPHQEVKQVWNDILKPLGYIEAYQKKNGQKEPNSTDVHGLYKDKKNQPIGNLGAYMAKYVSKVELDSKLFVDGKIWGRSANLEKIKFYSDIEDSELFKIWNFFYDNFPDKVEKEYFKMIKVNSWDILEKNFPSFFKKMIDFYSNQIELLYK